MNNKIFLRRKNKLVVEKGNGKSSVAQIATLNKNLESLGYTLSQNLIKVLRTFSPAKLQKFYLQLVGDLKEIKGVRKFEPFYPNFPEQVMNASDAELYLNAVLHYFSAWVSDILDTDTDTIWLPKYKKEKRSPLLDRLDLTVIDLGTEEEFEQIFTNLMGSKTSISDTDKADLKWFLNQTSTRNKSVLPEEIPNKEILAFVGAELCKSVTLNTLNLFSYFKTATDVLRLAVAMSDGDVSLADKTKFRNFTRGERKGLLALLEKAGSLENIKEDMLRWRDRWIRLGERLHPSEYTNKFSKAAKAFDALRNAPQTIETFNSKVEQALEEENVKEAVSLLKDRSGVFARRLDHLLRIKPTVRTISAFKEVCENVSTPVLLQVMSHFKNRNSKNDLRVFFPKGNLAKVKAIENTLPPINKKYCDGIVEACESALKARFKKLPKLGKCFVNEELKNYLVPFSQRSASRSLRTLVRGSRIPFGTDKDTLRFFIWWNENVKGRQNIGRIDLDLSAVMFDENWNSKGNVSYFNLRWGSGSSKDYPAIHSGDITSAPKGASEFIDINIPKMLASGARYIAMSVNSYTTQGFNDLPEAQAGWMLREYPNSGEVYEPATIVNKLDLTNESTVCVPMVVDLKNREIIWMDMAIKRNSLYVNNVAGNKNSIAIVARSFTQLSKPNLHDLFRLHAEARGRIVKKESTAEVIFDQSKAFELEKIASEYL